MRKLLHYWLLTTQYLQGKLTQLQDWWDYRKYNKYFAIQISRGHYLDAMAKVWGLERKYYFNDILYRPNTKCYWGIPEGTKNYYTWIEHDEVLRKRLIDLIKGPRR